MRRVSKSKHQGLAESLSSCIVLRQRSYSGLRTVCATMCGTKGIFPEDSRQSAPIFRTTSWFGQRIGESLLTCYIKAVRHWAFPLAARYRNRHSIWRSSIRIIFWCIPMRLPRCWMNSGQKGSSLQPLACPFDWRNAVLFFARSRARRAGGSYYGCL